MWRDGANESVPRVFGDCPAARVSGGSCVLARLSVERSGDHMNRLERAAFGLLDSCRAVLPGGVSLRRVIETEISIALVWIAMAWAELLIVKYVLGARTVFVYQAIEVCKGAAFTAALLWFVVHLLVLQQWRELK